MRGPLSYMSLTSRDTHSKLASRIHSCLCIHVTEARATSNTRPTVESLCASQETGAATQPPDRRISVFVLVETVVVKTHTDLVDV